MHPLQNFTEHQARVQTRSARRLSGAPRRPDSISGQRSFATVWSRLLAAGCLLLSACAAQRSYVLLVNAGAPERTQLCEVEVADGGVANDASSPHTNCAAPGTVLEADHQLAVRVTNSAGTNNYELRVDQ